MNNIRFKFRVWEHHNKKFSVSPHGFCLDKNFTLGIPDDSFDGESRKFTIQQYTGLQDLNGKDVYEGDIVKFKDPVNYIAQIIWSEEDSAFLTRNFKENSGAFLNPQYMMNYTVIGNIFENKEFLI